MIFFAFNFFVYLVLFELIVIIYISIYLLFTTKLEELIQYFIKCIIISIYLDLINYYIVFNFI